jgi:hypothetical protein
VAQFNIPFLLIANGTSEIEQVTSALDQIEKHQIKIAPWPEFSYQPDVAFTIAHNGDNVFLKYYVEEKSVAAIYRETNGPVYKDSCVEFFIDFSDERGYYNIEFNCAGSCHIGFGNEKEGRLQVPREFVKKIKYQALFKTGGLPNVPTIKWELGLMIPLEVFYYHRIGSLKNKLCRINFYKCGDELPQPHYLSWAVMTSAAPNFHLPEFFAEAQFADDRNILLTKEKYVEDSV